MRDLISSTLSPLQLHLAQVSIDLCFQLARALSPARGGREGSALWITGRRGC